MSASEAERDAMRRALALALNGPVGVNPQVGAVILAPDGTVLAEGWHRGAGTAHAEVDALSQLERGRARGTTAVVTLEPCNHAGRTGPCSEALIAAGVARVVYAIDDPGVRSSGGARRLRAAGVDVESGLLAEEATALLSSWLEVQRLGRPHVTVKWAQSLDGRAAAADGTSQWITGPAAREDVHRRRARAGAIVVGTGTVLADDPALTARTPSGALAEHQPIPVVLGRRDTPADAAVRRHPHRPRFYDGGDLPAVLADLRDAGVQSVFVEGGPTVASAFVRAGLADEILAYLAPVLLGGPRLALSDVGVGTITAARRLDVRSIERLGDDLLLVAAPASPAADAAASVPITEGDAMFTGIVEEIGEVTAVAPSGDGVRLTVRAPKAVSDAAHGDSISVSGVCLTVVDHDEEGFTADVMRQTLDMSTLAGVAPGRRVNLERATAAHGRLGGHIVQGHVDGGGDVIAVRPGAEWRVLRISLPPDLAPLVVDKGSIAVDGVSLTVSAVSAPHDPAPWFEVSLIPETLEATTLGDRVAGDRVNLETDILARHVRRLLAFTPTDPADASAPAPNEGGSR